MFDMAILQLVVVPPSTILSNSPYLPLLSPSTPLYSPSPLPSFPLLTLSLHFSPTLQDEYAVPEQFKSRWDGKALVTVCTDINS